MANPNGIGIRNFFITLADQLFTSNVTLASLGLGGATGIPIAANQTKVITYWVKVTVGATGGIRAQVTVPAGGVIFGSTIRVNNTVAPATVLAVQQSSAVFTNALANAGTHWVEITVVVVNGTTPGTIDLQMAQNTTDVLTLTILRGANADVITI